MATITPWGHEYTIPIWAVVALYLFVGFLIAVVMERTGFFTNEKPDERVGSHVLMVLAWLPFIALGGTIGVPLLIGKGISLAVVWVSRLGVKR